VSETQPYVSLARIIRRDRDAAGNPNARSSAILSRKGSWISSASFDHLVGARLLGGILTTVDLRRLPGLVADLLDRKVDVLFAAGGTDPALAEKTSVLEGL
jgi:hypothetical protein